ncbi:MAG: PaaI family thioesterase [Burkholderiaceae bacterium]
MPTLSAQLERFIQASFARQGALMAWQARLHDLAPGACAITLPMSAAVTQQHGYFHGGVIGALADAAGGYAANTLLMPEAECLTAEYKINILAPGIGEALVARGSLLKKGRTLVIARADVFAVNGGAEKLCAVMQQTLFAIPCPHADQFDPQP